MWKKKKRKEGEIIPDITRDYLDTEDLLILDDIIGDDEEDEDDGIYDNDIYDEDTCEDEEDEDIDGDGEEWLF